jgi:hypothetical protein
MSRLYHLRSKRAQTLLTKAASNDGNPSSTLDAVHAVLMDEKVESKQNARTKVVQYWNEQKNRRVLKKI